MSKVYIVQQQYRRDPITRELKPLHDFTPAEQYGDFVFLLDHTASPFAKDAVLDTLRERLSDYTDDDYLLLVGSPSFIGWACAIAAGYNGRVNLLHWSNAEKTYVPIFSQVFDD